VGKTYTISARKELRMKWNLKTHPGFTLEILKVSED
jgi:hypothetical protein